MMETLTFTAAVSRFSPSSTSSSFFVFRRRSRLVRIMLHGAQDDGAAHGDMRVRRGEHEQREVHDVESSVSVGDGDDDGWGDTVRICGFRERYEWVLCGGEHVCRFRRGEDEERQRELRAAEEEEEY